MAYDNGQLLSLYANAYKLTKNELYREIIVKTTSFIEKEWFTDEGAFYSALDADSFTAENVLEEGAFYVWTKNELKKLLQNDFELFSEVFNINEFGHWEHENYVLIQNESLEKIAEKNDISIDKLRLKKKNWEQLLYQTREKRPKPRLDDKCITSWNAILLKGFVDAYKALGNENHLNLALNNAQFIVNKIWSPDGNLMHTYKNKRTTINGFLEDYAFIVDSFLALYEATFDETWLLHGKNLTNYCLDHFYDEKKQLFRFTSDLDEALIAHHFEIEDNVIPASNSIMASNLFKLGVYFENSHFEEIARQMILQVIPSIDYPSAFSNWLIAALHFSDYQKELAICSKDSLVHSKDINRNYLPSILLSGSEKKSDLPFLQNRYIEDETLFYLCQNKMCLAPKNNISSVYEELNH